MSSPFQGPTEPGASAQDAPSDADYSPEVTWTADDYAAMAKNSNTNKTSPSAKRPRPQSQKQQGGTPLATPSAKQKPPLPPSTPVAAVAAAAADDDDQVDISNVDTPGDKLWPTRASLGNDVTFLVVGQPDREFATVPPGWTVRLGDVYGPLNARRPTGPDVVAFDVPGRGTFYMDIDDNVFSYAPISVRILRDGRVQDPMVTPVYPPQGTQVLFLVEGSDNVSTTFPHGGQLEFQRVHRAENEATEITPDQPRALIPFYVPGTPSTRGGYFIDRDGEVYDYQPRGWKLRVPEENLPQGEEHEDEPEHGDDENKAEDEPQAPKQDKALPPGPSRPLRALIPRISQFGVRFYDPSRPNAPNLKAIPPGRQVDVSDVAPSDASPPRMWVAQFIWRGRKYFIDAKDRIYFFQPGGCFIKTSFEKEPAPSQPSPPKNIGQKPASLKQSTPSGAASTSQKKKATTQATTPSKAPTSASKSTSFPPAMGPDFQWLPPTANMTWRQMGRMVRAARRRLNEIERQALAKRAGNPEANGLRPSSRGLARARWALKESTTATRRTREEPEERYRGTQGNSSAQGPLGKTPSGSKASPSSTGNKQATKSATGDKYPQSVEITDMSLLSITRPITKEYSSPSLAAKDSPASPSPAKLGQLANKPLKKIPGLQAVQASKPAKASPLRQEIQLASDPVQPPPASPSPSAPGQLMTPAKVPVKQLVMGNDFPGFSVRSAQESRTGPSQNWIAANYPPTHSRHLNEAVESLYFRDWFRDEHLTACMRLATQRPQGSSADPSSTQPRTYCFKFVLSQAQEQAQVVLGSTSAEALAFQAAELRIIPANSSDLPEIEDMTEWADETQSLGSHWAVAMEHRGTFYYFDTCRRDQDSVHRGNHGLRLLGWYRRIRAAAGVGGTLRFRVVDVEPQDDGWESGFLAAELVRKVVQDHNGDPSTVTDWGPQTPDAILQKWARAIIQDLGTAYRSPVPIDERGQGGRALAFQALIPPMAKQNASLSSSLFSTTPSTGGGRPGATQAKRLNVRTRSQTWGRMSHARRGGAQICQGSLLSTSDQEILIKRNSLPGPIPSQAGHIERYGGQVISLKRTRLEVETDDGEMHQIRKMGRRR